MQDSIEREHEVVAQTPMTEWANEPTLKHLKQEYRDAKIEHDTQIGKIQVWRDNYHVTGSAKIDTPTGRSSIQPKLIRKQAEWRYPSLSEPFLSTDDVFNVHPVTYEDKEAARQNELLLNHQFNRKLNKVHFIDEYVRTAVDEGTVIVRVGWEFEEEEQEVEKPVIEFLPANSPQHMQMLQKVSQGDRNVEPEWITAYQLTEQHGMPLVPIQTGTEKVTEMVTVKNQPTLEICDNENVILDPTCKGNIDNANFMIYSFETSLAQLKKDPRYKNLDQINLETNSILAEPDHAEDETSNFNFQDKPRKLFVAYEYWGYWDIKGDGTVVPIVATWVGDTLIRMEENPFPDRKLPFVVVPYLPVRKQSHGEPDGEVLVDNQKVIGAVTRGMIDIMARSANGQMGTRKDALDLTNKRKFERGEDYQFNANVDPRQAFHMHTYPEVPASAQVMLQMQNAEAESLTGVKAFNNGISGETLGEVAAGVRGALDASSKREMSILRRLKQGMIEVGRKIIAMNAVFLDEEEVVRITNENYVTVRREELAGEFDLQIDISTAEEDNRRASDLSFMLQTLGNTVDPKITMMLLSEAAELRKMPRLANELRNYEPQPDPLEVQKKQLEIELLRAQIAEVQSKTHENYMEAQLDQAKAQNLSSDTDLKNLDFVEQESGVKQERELQKMGEQAKANAKLELVKSALNPPKQPK